jgi:hypothetical protein
MNTKSRPGSGSGSGVGSGSGSGVGSGSGSGVGSGSGFGVGSGSGSGSASTNRKTEKSDRQDGYKGSGVSTQQVIFPYGTSCFICYK